MRRSALIGRAYAGVWLLFLAYPVSSLFRPGIALELRWSGVLGIALFAALYVWLTGAHWAGARVGIWHYAGLAAMTLLAGAGTLVLATNGLALFIFAAVSATSVLPPWQGAAASAVLAGAVLAMGARFGPLLGSTAFFAAETLLIGISLIGIRRMAETIRELQAARQEIARLAVADERLRFARDLHDLLGHSLSVITLKSELAGRLLPASPERAAAEVADIERVAREALREVREAVSGYRQAQFWREVDAARQVLSTAGIACTYNSEVAAELPPELQSVLGWAVREAATNVLRHSGARHCAIRIGTGAGWATLEVTDDGRGADSPDAGNGLRGLSERALACGGRLEAGPGGEGGYRLAVSVPLP